METPRLWPIRWHWMRGQQIAHDTGVLEQCARLFSAEYGYWSVASDKAGKRVIMTRSIIESLVQDDSSWMALCYSNEELLGYCIAHRIETARGKVAWISQLVVRSADRNQGIATKMLFSIWQFTDCYAWGLVTASPYAVRALETATRRPCRDTEIRQHFDELGDDIHRHIGYIPPALVTDDSGRTRPKVNTEFYLDHSELPTMLEGAARGDRPWNLGNLDEGEEWFACTFRHQEPTAIEEERLSQLLESADQIWIDAYEGMTLDDSHAWRSHTESEVETITSRCHIESGPSVLDIGCGDGRHVQEFAKRELHVIGIDISQRLIERAKAMDPDGRYLIGDCRKPDALRGETFGLVVALYDVIGSSGRLDDDRAILDFARARISNDGCLVLSVLNFESIYRRLDEGSVAQNVEEFVRALELLPPSRAMQDSGSIFDPRSVIVFRGCFYRKEQFDEAYWRLPCELVVRDRRFTSREIVELVEGSGFTVEDVVPVQAGGWSREPRLEESDPRAKELLVIARPSGSR